MHDQSVFPACRVAEADRVMNNNRASHQQGFADGQHATELQIENEKARPINTVARNAQLPEPFSYVSIFLSSLSSYLYSFNLDVSKDSVFPKASLHIIFSLFLWVP